MSVLRYIDADTLAAALDFAGAADALERAMRDGLDLSAQPARSVVDVRAGQLLLMPAEVLGGVGVKIAGVAPDNPSRGLGRIQATYVLLDAATLQPKAAFDGAALTLLRTPALSAIAVRRFAADARQAVIFGTGPQAHGHAQALAAVAPGIAVQVVGRQARQADELVERLSGAGIHASRGDGNLSAADVIVCATSARSPVVDGSAVADSALVIAVGSHEPDVREVDTALVVRSTVVVEDVQTALREAGDLIIPIDEGVLTADRFITLQDALREPEHSIQGPVLFKSVGMGWEDLVVADAALRRLDGAA